MTNQPRNFAPSMTMTTAFRHAAASVLMAAFACVSTLHVEAQTDPAADELLLRVSEAMRGYETVPAVYSSKMVDRQSDFEMDQTIAEDGIDPARMFTIWEEGFKKVMKSDAKLGDRLVQRVDLHPDGSEDRSFHTIQCYIDPTSLEVVQLIVKGREGTDVEYRIDEFEGNGNIPEGAFTFDKAQFPGTTVIDNRL